MISEVVIFLVAASLVLGLAIASRVWSYAKILNLLGAKRYGQEFGLTTLQGIMDDLAREHRRVSPQLLVSHLMAPNAIALMSPRGKPIVILTKGLLCVLDADEQKTVLASILAQTIERGFSFHCWVSYLVLPLSYYLPGPRSALGFLGLVSRSWILRLILRHRFTFRRDRTVSRWRGSRNVALVYKKVALLGRKIPFDEWCIAIEPLFLISPFSLRGKPIFWYSLQPPIDLRIQKLIDSKT